MYEDFAEAFELYIKTDGGIAYPHIARTYTHRFTILDEIMGVTPSERKEINKINELFEIQTNALLEKFGLPTSEILPKLISPEEYIMSAISDFRGEISESLKNFWREYPHHIEISRVLADKIQTLKESRSLDPSSFENLLSQIQNYILKYRFWINDDGDEKIPEFITETVYYLDTLPISEIEYRLRILEQIEEIFSEDRGIATFEQALKEVLER